MKAELLLERPRWLLDVQKHGQFLSESGGATCVGKPGMTLLASQVSITVAPVELLFCVSLSAGALENSSKRD